MIYYQVYGTDESEALYGDVWSHQNSAVVGYEGNDFIASGSGDDILVGMNGKDTIYAGGGEDYVHGGKGNDTLFGHDGDDTVIGDRGHDFIAGGRGRDELTGGRGRDDFVFYSTEESVNFGDVITDFNRGQGDEIDLLRIDADTTRAGNQTFHFIGEITSAASAPQKGEIGYVHHFSGDTHVYVNTDNDATAEMTFILEGTHNLLSGDFDL